MLLPHASAHENLFLPGLAPDGVHPRTHMHFGDIWRHVGVDHARGGRAEVYGADLDRLARRQWPGQLVGRFIFDRVGVDGAILTRHIGHNIITDLGAIAMLKGAFGNAAGTPAQFVALDQSLANATLNGTVAPGTITTLTVTGTGPAGYTGGVPSFVAANAASSFQSGASNNGQHQNNNNVGVVTAAVGLDTVYGTGIIASFGTANAEGVAGSVTTNSATNINITSYTTTKTHTSGDWVLANPSVIDNPSSSPAGIAFSSAQSQAPSGSGIGLRSTVYSYTWTAGVLAAGQYARLWLATSITPAAGIWYASAALTPQNVSLVAGAIITYTISI